MSNKPFSGSIVRFPFSGESDRCIYIYIHVCDIQKYPAIQLHPQKTPIKILFFSQIPFHYPTNSEIFHTNSNGGVFGLFSLHPPKTNTSHCKMLVGRLLSFKKNMIPFPGETIIIFRGEIRVGCLGVWVRCFFWGSQTPAGPPLPATSFNFSGLRLVV